MKLHKNQTLFTQLLNFSANKLLIRPEFQKDISEMFIHDQHEFDIPMGWQTKTVNESPLYNNFPALWSTLSQVYQRELSPLVFAEIPDQKLIAKSFMKILEEIKK